MLENINLDTIINDRAFEIVKKVFFSKFMIFL